MEIRLRGGGLVTIRDGAYSRFDRSNVIEEFTPTQGLKGFLSKYVDESAVYRRQSQSEDDNPPSPITMEDSHGGSPAFFRWVKICCGLMHCCCFVVYKHRAISIAPEMEVSVSNSRLRRPRAQIRTHQPARIQSIKVKIIQVSA